MAKKNKRSGRPHYDSISAPPWLHRFKQEQIDAITNELINDAYPVALADLCTFSVTVLADKFGWGKELITIFCNELIANLNALQEGEISLHEQQEAIYDDYGILVAFDPDTKELTFETPSEERVR